MKTTALTRLIALLLIPFLGLFTTGCDSSEGSTTYTVVSEEEVCCIDEGVERYDYLATVIVIDENDIPIVGASVDLIVSDVPEIHLLGVTGDGGRAVFSFYTQPDTVVSAIVNAPQYEETYISEVTDPFTFELELVVGPRPL